MPTKDRQRALARAKLERQMARRAEAARRKRQVQAAIGAVIALVLVIAGATYLVMQFAGNDKDDAKTAASPSCSYPDLPAEQASDKSLIKDVGKPPTGDVIRTGTRTASLATNVGAITIELDAAKAPCTTNSFAYLADKKFFDKSSCHRLVTANIFVLQCGDPTGSKGKGGPAYRFGVENLPKGLHPAYPAGTVAMANSNSPDSNGSQFFVVFKDTELPASYTIFGKVTKGLDLVQNVAKAGVKNEQQAGSGDGEPKTAVTLNTVTVAAAAAG